MRLFDCCCKNINQESESSEDIEQTLIIIRGDVISRGLIGNVLSELEKNFSIVGMKYIQFDDDLVNKLYGNARHKDFYPHLKQYMLTGYHLAMVLEGENVIQRVLELKGKSPRNDQENTLRKKYGYDDCICSIHSSFNKKNAYREIRLFFSKNEIYKKIPNIESYLTITGVHQPQSNNKPTIELI